MKNITAVTVGTVVLLATVIAAISGTEGSGYYPRSQELTTTSTMVLPAVKPLSASVFVQTNAYSHGDYVKVYTNNAWRFWWCTTAGTTTNTTPAWSYTGTTTNGTAQFRYINPTRKRFQLINLGSANMSFAYRRPAVANRGYTVVGNTYGSISSGYSYDIAYQGEVYAIAESGTNTLSIHEE